VTNFLSAAKQLGHDFDAYAMQQMATTIIITIKLKYFLAKRERCQERERQAV